MTASVVFGGPLLHLLDFHECYYSVDCLESSSLRLEPGASEPVTLSWVGLGHHSKPEVSASLNV